MQNRLTQPLSAIYNIGYLILLQIKNFFNLMVEARERQANYEVAQVLHRVEYRGYSFESVLSAVENGKLSDLK
jgi:hypothetical protein